MLNASAATKSRGVALFSVHENIDYISIGCDQESPHSGTMYVGINWCILLNVVLALWREYYKMDEKFIRSYTRMSERLSPSEAQLDTKELPSQFIILNDSTFRRDFKKGVSIMIESIIKDHASAVFFLDKGARPIAWCIREVWKKKYADTPMPEMRFADIGRRDEPYFDQRVAQQQNIPTAEDQNRFEDTFGKDVFSGIVYVIDDKFDTGCSLTRARKMIAAANPHAVLRDMWIFPKWSYSRMPWSIHRGSTGVVEVGDITTRRITRPRLDEIQEKLWNMFDAYSASPVSDALEEYCRPRYPRLQEALNSAVMSATQYTENQDGLTPELQTLLEAIKSFRLPVLPESHSDDRTKKDFFFSLVKSWDQVYEFLKSIEKMSYEFDELILELRRLIYAFEEATVGLHQNDDGDTYDSQVIAAVDQYNEYSDVSKLRERERQLRLEISLLANEI